MDGGKRTFKDKAETEQTMQCKAREGYVLFSLLLLLQEEELGDLVSCMQQPAKQMGWMDRQGTG